MSKTLTEIAKQLQVSNKKVQLIYAFNGTGKTRLSREFKQLITPKKNTEEGDDNSEYSRHKILYYNAFTEDLFYWDNDLKGDAEPKLKIQPNTFTDWVLKDQGQDQNIIANFQRYTNDKLTPHFNAEYDKYEESPITKVIVKVKVPAYSEVKFSLERGDDAHTGNLKISKGEESNFVWSIFYTLIEQVIEILNVAESSDRETGQFDLLEYVFVDDPVSSLDENHLIELAIDLARLIKSSESNLKFVITTHNPLFYNVLYNEFSKAPKYLLKKNDDGLFDLVTQASDSPFSYHLYLRSELKRASETGQINKYHFNFMRNVLEKTSTFLGYKDWGDLLPNEASGTDSKLGNPYARIINFYNHAKHSADEVTEVKDDHKRVFKFLVKEIDKLYQIQW